jgi:hypothetical protein
MAANYTEEQVKHMVEAYRARPDRTTVDMLAEDLNKSVKSIIGKLSREGVYQKAIYKTKTGEVPVTKAELVSNLAEFLDIDSIKIMGLEKAPKQDIKYLCESVTSLVQEIQNG